VFCRLRIWLELCRPFPYGGYLGAIALFAETPSLDEEAFGKNREDEVMVIFAAKRIGCNICLQTEPLPPVSTIPKIISAPLRRNLLESSRAAKILDCGGRA
jgi:hypothetical protein